MPSAAVRAVLLVLAVAALLVVGRGEVGRRLGPGAVAFMKALFIVATVLLLVGAFLTALA